MRHEFTTLQSLAIAAVATLLLGGLLTAVFGVPEARAQFGSSFFGEPQTLIYLGHRSRTVVGPTAMAIDTRFQAGHNTDTSNTTFETVWSEGGFYSWPSSALSMSIASSDADDTSAGTGARTVSVYGYDDDLLELDPIIITLSGQTPVAIPTDLERVFRAVVDSAGASNGNEGTIRVGTGTFTAGVPTTVYAAIVQPASTNDGDEVNQSGLAGWTCPSDATCLLESMQVACSSDCTYRVKVRLLGGLWRSVFQSDALSGNALPVSRGTGQYRLPGSTDIEVQVESLTGGMIGAGAAMTVRIYRAP